jgi:hypothetical protein
MLISYYPRRESAARDFFGANELVANQNRGSGKYEVSYIPFNERCMASNILLKRTNCPLTILDKIIIQDNLYRTFGSDFYFFGNS